MLLGVRAVLAESYERIHRANLVGMGILPLELPAGETVSSLGLTGHETFEITGLEGTGADGFLARSPSAPTTRSSPAGSGSTPPTRSSTTATAASSSTSCASCRG